MPHGLVLFRGFHPLQTDLVPHIVAGILLLSCHKFIVNILCAFAIHSIYNKYFSFNSHNHTGITPGIGVPGITTEFIILKGTCQ